MFENCKYKWDYIPTKQKQDAYEQLIANMSLPEPVQFEQLPPREQQQIVQNFIKEIRKINVFPVFYFNDEGIKKEILSVIHKNDVYFQEDSLQVNVVQGSTLLDYMFPNLHHVIAGAQRTNPTMYDIFYNDAQLESCLLRFMRKNKVHSLRTAFFSIARYQWRAAINFSPVRAKVIYEYFCPKDGVIYDYSAGFGGRLLGALSSKNNYKYIAVQPNTDTYYNLIQLGNKIQQVTGRQNSFQIYHQGSQNFTTKEKVDFAFSCPPFFDLQRYTDEETQSIVKYPEYSSWLQNYVRDTIKNCYNSLKEEGIFAVDLMNYFKNRKKISLKEDWVKIAQEEGFVLQESYKMISRSRKKYQEDKEELLVFIKSTNTKYSINEQVKKEYQEKIQKVQKEKKENKNKIYCLYNAFNGKLQNQFPSLEELQQYVSIPIEDIKYALKKKKRHEEFFFKVYIEGEAPIEEKLDFKKIFCKIDNRYFDSFAEAGRYLQVSRQAVQQASKRKSKTINGHNIEWYEENGDNNNI